MESKRKASRRTINSNRDNAESLASNQETQMAEMNMKQAQEEVAKTTQMKVGWRTRDMDSPSGYHPFRHSNPMHDVC